MMGLIANIINDNKFTPADVPEFENKLFFEGAARRVNLERFAILLFLATFIATYGVLGDSVATVIGAMIIAPLMRPIMGTAAGLVMGDMRRAGLSFLTVVLGVAGTIFTAWFLSNFLNTTVISFTYNSSITGRISPSLNDLMVALASGAAGAFAMSRSDVADTLPGVAISISLVPPLCVVGIGLSQRDLTVASGAMLLFLTNFLSILLAGGGVLALLGLSAASTKKLTGTARRKAFAVIIAGLVLVAIPLTLTSISVANESLLELEARNYVTAWLDSSNYEANIIDADEDLLQILITGYGELPEIGNLGTEMRSKVDPRMKIILRVLQADTYQYPLQGAE